MAVPHNEFEWAGEPDSPQLPDAPGTLLTTARDYAALVVHLLNDTLASGVVRTMWTPQVRIASSRMFALDTVPVNAATNRLAWALGWGSFESSNGRAFFHTGQKGGVRNYVVVFPERGIGAVLLSNSDNFEGVAAEIVAAAIGDRESPFDWLGYQRFDSTKRRVAPPRPVAIPVEAVVIAPYAGVYEFGPGSVVHIRADGKRLFASDDGQSGASCSLRPVIRSSSKGGFLRCDSCRTRVVG